MAELERRVAIERDALRRDRYRAVLLALDGEEAVEIAEAIGRARRGVQDRAYVYRDGGVDAVQPARRKGRTGRTGRTPEPPRTREPELAARPGAGPTPAGGGACTLRGKDVVRIPAAELGVTYTPAGACELLERPGYSCLAPRPRHEKGDPAARERFRTEAPFLSGR